MSPNVTTVHAGTLRDAIDTCSSECTISLEGDTNESITIPSDKDVTLNLNGFMLSSDGTASGDTITVALGSTLTLNGEGSVDNTYPSSAAVFNNGTTTIGDEVTLTCSKENGAGWVWDEAKEGVCPECTGISTDSAHFSISSGDWGKRLIESF